MLDVFTVADTLVSHAVKYYGQEIDIIGYYGSYAQDSATAYSDLDIFYVPVDGADPPVGRTFLLEGRLFDFWAIRWETLAGFATGQLRGWALAPALVYYTRPLYTRSPEQIVRLDQLKQRIDELRQPEARPAMIKRALAAFPGALGHLELLRGAVADGALADTRHAAWDVITVVIECLALANQTFLDRGFARLLESLPRFTRRPTNLDSLITTIATSGNPATILAAADELIGATRAILLDLQRSLPPQATPRTAFNQAYPELRGAIDKVRSACNRGDPVAASAAARTAQHELSLMLAELGSGEQHGFNRYTEFAGLYRQLGFADLLTAPAGDLGELATQATLLDRQLRAWLTQEAVDLGEFDSLPALQQALTRTTC